ncbi:glycosyltransferase family 4 protein [Bacillus toyonensis]|uniref:glycosyltransferase family 4 protein n=1 Tax=Bacillus toyonensis TaxID=155322 RepID=UPI000BF2D8DA|nr:glycosyltransferase family 4 protein [Bacillus toyonensis]MBU4642695.1 glycosyltransferase family 4 protein [Bacillus toyonensis]PEO76826.1 glycosyl transferase family 1 [Bacillus toyonensis]PHD35814.1 glycosyl transferase family 1 [Bacillus toyonensis]
MNYIIFPGELDIRKGGPAGYIANLQKGLKLINEEDKVTLITKENVRSNNTIRSRRNSVLKPLLGRSNTIIEKLYIRNSIKLRDLSIRDQINKINFEYQDITHVHSVLDYQAIQNHNITGKTILTPHTPESTSDEIVNAIRFKFDNPNLKLSNLREKLKVVEEEAFRNCEYFIFPSEESMEIYSTFIKDFYDIMKDKKIYYNPTGCEKLSYKLSRDEFRDKYNIPKDAFLISYIGRHTKIKGFDILKDVAKEINKIDSNIFFVSGGTGDIKSESENFIEVGWTDDPGSIVNASDLFILPNKNTYFDLVLLEVLSIGTPVLASNTGGNKSVGKLTNGVRLFESGNEKDVISEILYLKDNKDICDSMRKDNITCYKDNYTLEGFAERYIKILNDISFNS